LIGPTELAALDRLSAPEREQRIADFVKLPMAAIVVTSGTTVPSDLRSMARSSRLPLLTTALRSSVALKRIEDYLNKMQTRRLVVHGVLMDIYGLGTLILGESGIGKSESALELIERGHRLVSDDVVEIWLSSTNSSSDSKAGMLTGRSPDLTRYYMELRGLGVIDVKDLFGASSIRVKKSVDLVIQLERWEKATQIERLGLEEESYPLLGQERPLVRMPVGPGRNLAMLIEVAARNHLLKQAGRHPARRLVRKIAKEARRQGTATHRSSSRR
jgi:HPr kinase/phosphorylase